MKMNKEIKDIKNSKIIYDAIEIPEELNQRVMDAIQRAGEVSAIPVRKNYYGRKTAMAAACVFVCFTTGLNVSESFASTVEEIPLLGEISKVLTFRSYESKDEDKTVSVEIPQIQTENSEKEEEHEEKKETELIVNINEEIQKIVEDYERDANQRILEYKEAFLQTGGTEEEFAQKDIKVNVTYEVKYETDTRLSLVLEANENWTGAYGIRYYYNIDFEGDKILTLRDILGEHYVEISNTSILRQMKERMESDENLIYWTGENGFEGFETVTDENKFYINKNGNPVIVFDKYEIAPGAFGIQEFEIKKEEIN